MKKTIKMLEQEIKYLKQTKQELESRCGHLEGIVKGQTWSLDMFRRTFQQIADIQSKTNHSE